MLLGARFRLLAAQTLLHYPALWWASLRGRVPLHVSVTAGADGVTMIAGPGGVGKSTMLAAGLPRGEIATADNICACDARTAYGLVEPLRVARRPGRRERRTARPPEVPAARAGALPGAGPAGGARAAPPAGEAVRSGRCPPAEAARELVAGTYMAGELRRFWPFAGHPRAGDGHRAGAPGRGRRGRRARRPAALRGDADRARARPTPIGELLRMAGVR